MSSGETPLGLGRAQHDRILQEDCCQGKQSTLGGLLEWSQEPVKKHMLQSGERGRKELRNAFKDGKKGGRASARQGRKGCKDRGKEARGTTVPRRGMGNKGRKAKHCFLVRGHPLGTMRRAGKDIQAIGKKPWVPPDREPPAS